jgi:glycosyltransferase involved in cell wall biosynthesis
VTVVQVAYPFAPVGRDAVGGAEQVLHAIDAALVEAGHRSVIVALEGSRCAGRLVPFSPRAGPLDDAAQRRGRAAFRELVRRVADGADVVHLHGVDFHAYLPPAGPPALVTLHLPRAWYPPAALRPDRPRTHLHCVSAAQRREFAGAADLLPEIPNGVPVARFRMRRRRARFALALGRISPEKGFHLALAAARRAGAPLVLAGEVFPYPDHERHFAAEIAPRLDAARRFVGPVGFARKRRLLSAARCVLVPSLAPESSSLVAMESLASGAPVVAFPSGALAELVEEGRTGFLVRDGEEMAAAIARADRIRPEDCRRAAEERFDARRMVAAYLGLYERLATAASIATSTATSTSTAAREP